MNAVKDMTLGFAKPWNAIDNSSLTSKQVEALTSDVNAFDILPSAHEMAEELIVTIRAEERAIVPIKRKDITLEEDGTVRLGETDMLFSKDGAFQLANAIGPRGAGRYICGVDRELRTMNLRYLLDLEPDESIKLRTRNASDGNGREIYSVTNNKYPDVGAAAVLSRIAARTPPESRAVYTYDPTSTRVTFREMLRPNITPSTFNLRDVFKVGRAWTLKDDGNTSIQAALLVFRHMCANMAMLNADSFKLPSVRHRGEESRVLDRVNGLFEASGPAIAKFSETWAWAMKHAVLPASCDNEFTATQEIYTYLLRNKLIPCATSDIPELSLKLSLAWAEEPGGFVSHYINGLTRVARDMPRQKSNLWRKEAYETAANKLLSLPASRWTKIGKVAAEA